MVYNFVSKTYDLRWWWSANPRNRGRSKKIKGQTALKSRGNSLAMGSYLQRGNLSRGPNLVDFNID